MGSSASSVDLVSSTVGFKSKLCCFNCEGSCVKHEQLTCDNAQKNVKQILLRDLESSSNSEEEVEDFSDSIVKELGISLCEAVHIHDHPEPLEIYKQKEVAPIDFEADVLKGLDKYASILCSELVQLYPVSSNAGDALPTVLHNASFSKAENIALAQPLPVSAPKLVSALKGSRAREGKSLSTNLSVKWAPEVYDPPVTSSSHTVKGSHRNHHHHHHHHHYHQRPKSKKDYYKQACSKGKSSRSSVIERKHSQQRSSSSSSLVDPRIARSQALGYNRALPNACSQSKVDPMDITAVNSNETIKHGGNCYMEPLAPPVQLPVAKAS